jgi:hypothetical protein
VAVATLKPLVRPSAALAKKLLAQITLSQVVVWKEGNPFKPRHQLARYDAMPSGGALKIETHDTTLDSATAAGIPDVYAGEFCVPFCQRLGARQGTGGAAPSARAVLND